MIFDPILDPVKIITTILSFAVAPGISYAERNEFVIKTLKKLKIHPAHPPKDDRDVIYAYALVEFGIGQPKSILNIFRIDDIKTSFWRNFNLDPDSDSDSFVKIVLCLIRPKKEIRDEIMREFNLKEERDIERRISPDLKKFYQVYINVTKLARKPSEALKEKGFRKLLKSINQLPNSAEVDAKLKEEIGIIPKIVSPYPEEFKSLIKEKTEIFCGRQFVFDAIKEFIENNPKGYFTIISDAGMGKSAIAAQYVLDRPGTICFFNIRAEGKNTP